MATLRYSTDLSVNSGNQNDPVNGRHGVIIEPNNLTADVGNTQIAGNIVTPDQVARYAAGFVGVSGTQREFDNVDTGQFAHVNTAARIVQFGNIHVVWGPGVTFDCSGWDMEIYDNGNRFAGFQFGGTEGDTQLASTTVLLATDDTYITTVGRRGNTTVLSSLLAWEVAKAQLLLDRTNIRYIKNVSGNTGSGAASSMTLALNAEIVLQSNPSYISSFGTQTNIQEQGIGFHPNGGAGNNPSVRAITAATGWRKTNSWTNGALIQNGRGTGVTNSITLKFNADGNTINEPRVISRDGGSLEFYSGQQAFGGVRAKWRFNTSGQFNSTGLTIDEFNHGGGEFAVDTTATFFVNQGSGHLNQQVFLEGQSLAGDTTQLIFAPRSNDLILDAWDLGGRPILVSALTEGAEGHWDSFKRRYFDLSTPATILDAPLGTDSSFKSWIRNGGFESGLADNSRYTEGQEITLDSGATITTDGDLQYTPEFMVRNFTDFENTKANVDTTSNANNRLYFESRETSALRIPEAFVNSNENATTRMVRRVGEAIHSYVQYPYIPMLVQEGVQDLSYGAVENADSTLVRALSEPAYLIVTNQATVAGYTLLNTIFQAKDRAYYNYLEELKADGLDDTIANSDLTLFYLNGSTETTIVYTVGGVEFVLSQAGLIGQDGTQLQIQRTATFEGNITASNPSSVLRNTSGGLVNYGDGNIDFNAIESDDFFFEGTQITGSTTGSGRFIDASINGDVDISGQFEQGSNQQGGTFDSSGTVNEAIINGDALITGETTASVYNGTATLTSATLGDNNTFNDNVFGAPLSVNRQTFGDILLGVVTGAPGGWIGNSFTDTTILISAGVDVRTWDNTGTVTFDSNTAGSSLTLSPEQESSGDFIAGTNITFDVQGAIVPEETTIVAGPLGGFYRVTATKGAGNLNNITSTFAMTTEPLVAGTNIVLNLTEAQGWQAADTLEVRYKWNSELDGTIAGNNVYIETIHTHTFGGGNTTTPNIQDVGFLTDNAGVGTDTNIEITISGSIITVTNTEDDSSLNVLAADAQARFILGVTNSQDWFDIFADATDTEPNITMLSNNSFGVEASRFTERSGNLIDATLPDGLGGTVAAQVPVVHRMQGWGTKGVGMLYSARAGVNEIDGALPGLASLSQAQQAAQLGLAAELNDRGVNDHNTQASIRGGSYLDEDGNGQYAPRHGDS